MISNGSFFLSSRIVWLSVPDTFLLERNRRKPNPSSKNSSRRLAFHFNVHIILRRTALERTRSPRMAIVRRFDGDACRGDDIGAVFGGGCAGRQNRARDGGGWRRALA